MSERDILKMKDMLLLVGAILGIAGYAFSLGQWNELTRSHGKSIERLERSEIECVRKDSIHDYNFVKIGNVLEMDFKQ